jgi:hypothetical protein
MLSSSLIGGSTDLIFVAEGGRRILAPESSDSVERIQQALVLLGANLPESGIDGTFGNETGLADHYDEIVPEVIQLAWLNEHYFPEKLSSAKSE